MRPTGTRPPGTDRAFGRACRPMPAGKSGRLPRRFVAGTRAGSISALAVRRGSRVWRRHWRGTARPAGSTLPCARPSIFWPTRQRPIAPSPPGRGQRPFPGRTSLATSERGAASAAALGLPLIFNYSDGAARMPAALRWDRAWSARPDRIGPGIRTSIGPGMRCRSFGISMRWASGS